MDFLWTSTGARLSEWFYADADFGMFLAPQLNIRRIGGTIDVARHVVDCIGEQMTNEVIPYGIEGSFQYDTRNGSVLIPRPG